MVKQPHAFNSPSLYPPDRYRNAIMTSGTYSQQVTSPLLSLFNNSTVGRYLYVYGVQVWSQNSSVVPNFGGCAQGSPPARTVVPTVPLKPDEQILEGTFGYGEASPAPQGNQMLILGASPGFAYWPYQFPAFIVPPGWFAWIEVSGSSVIYGGAMQWFVGENTDQRPLVTMDVSDVA